MKTNHLKSYDQFRVLINKNDRSIGSKVFFELIYGQTCQFLGEYR